jgi:hydrogenase maturation protein HypF
MRSAETTGEGRRIRVRGTVQGVGFRPFVWRLAAEEKLGGHVANDGEGVLIEVFGAGTAVARFLARLTAEAPPLARIAAVEVAALAGPAPAGFAIVESGAGPAATGVAPDAATCPACLAEVADPSARRHGYAFTNCTHCGPRLSIVRAIPYDRANTSMAAFPMCADCARDYADPADRRFHAQPIACPACGPRLSLAAPDGSAIASADPIGATAALIRAGKIVAIKGIGGFQLACDATNAETVATLRLRKRRPRKPFALMARDAAMVRLYAACDADELAVLVSPAAPILLLDRKDGPGDLAPLVAPGQASLGVMLPATPLHHLLMAELDAPIVLTSGNLTDEPQAVANDEALARLGAIADAFLMNDRDIVNRLDDSVVRRIGGVPRVLRRARGYAPAPLAAPPSRLPMPRVLATGADLKNTICLFADGEAVLSQHIGDLGDALARDDLERIVRLYLDLYRFAPGAVAVDLHPDYHSRRLGLALAEAFGVPAVAIQHHHAHIAACLAENGRPLDAPPVVGIALDGAGFGPDGTVWGGEILVADYRGFLRAGHILPVALPGGDAAAREPWRNAFAHLDAALGFAAACETFPDLPIVRFLATKPVANLGRLIASGTAPRASSMGRLFDAVAATLGLCVDRQDYEGEAASLLEAVALPAFAGAPAYPAAVASADPLVISWEPLWHGILRDLADGVSAATIAAGFHRCVIDALAAAAMRIAAKHGATAVALSGGSFHNRLLLEGMVAALGRSGLEVLTHAAVPAGDGGIALGQAAVAAASYAP